MWAIVKMKPRSNKDNLEALKQGSMHTYRKHDKDVCSIIDVKAYTHNSGTDKNVGITTITYSELCVYYSGKYRDLP